MIYICAFEVDELLGPVVENVSLITAVFDVWFEPPPQEKFNGILFHPDQPETAKLSYLVVNVVSEPFFDVSTFTVVPVDPLVERFTNKLDRKSVV